MKNIYLLILLLITLFVFSYKSVENFADVYANKVYWDGKLSTVKEVMDKLRNDWKECGVSDFVLQPEAYKLINNRKRLIELLPITTMINRVTYDQVRCFVTKFDPANYLAVSVPIVTVPKILKPVNIVVVNNMLYHSTPYGVLKYMVPLMGSYKNSDSFNASIEGGILNDYNYYNTTFDPIFNVQGRTIQKRGNKFLDLKNNDIYEIAKLNDRIELLNKKIIDRVKDMATNMANVTGENITVTTAGTNTISSSTPAVPRSSGKEKFKVVEPMASVGGIIQLDVADPDYLEVINTQTKRPVEKGAIVEPKGTGNKEMISSSDNIKNALADPNQFYQDINLNKPELIKIVNTLVSINEYDGINYMFTANQVRPFSTWANSVNSTIEKYKLEIIGVIPHYYYTTEFNYRLLILLTDNFYVSVNNNVVSDIGDCEKELGVSFLREFPDKMSCNDLNVVINQMSLTNIINKEKAQQIMQYYRC